MIRIHKPASAPGLLVERGAALTAELCARADAGEPLRFDRGVYGAVEVKEALRAAQHDKCCFCEAKLGHAQFGDVEHFRPKASARQRAGGPPSTGYYWLAYTWTNLYLSCELCNRRHKGELFPLVNGEQRVSSHHRSADLEREQPLFIDPGCEDPTELIEFRREYAAPVQGNARGLATREALQLNRDRLAEHRRERLALLRLSVMVLARAIHRKLPDDGERELMMALSFIIDAAAASGEYSSMTRSLLRRVAPWRSNWSRPVATLLDELRTDADRGLVFQLAEF